MEPEKQTGKNLKVEGGHQVWGEGGLGDGEVRLAMRKRMNVDEILLLQKPINLQNQYVNNNNNVKSTPIQDNFSKPQIEFRQE